MFPIGPIITVRPESLARDFCVDTISRQNTADIVRDREIDRRRVSFTKSVAKRRNFFSCRNMCEAPPNEASWLGGAYSTFCGVSTECLLQQTAVDLII